MILERGNFRRIHTGGRALWMGLREIPLGLSAVIRRRAIFMDDILFKSAYCCFIAFIQFGKDRSLPNFLFHRLIKTGVFMDSVLTIGGVSTELLAEKAGTPLIVYDESQITDRISEFQRHFKSDQFETQIAYASKAFLCGAMVKIIKEKGVYLDVVSGGELHCALKNGFPMENILFHGNNKSMEELNSAFHEQVGLIVVDNAEECKSVIDLAVNNKQKMKVLLRLNPCVEAHTHKYVITAAPGSKFGVDINDRQHILTMVQSMKASGYVRFEGFHVHIGSQIFDLAAYKITIQKLMILMEELDKQYGIKAKSLNLGGGFAAYYTKEDSPIPTRDACLAIIKTCEEEKSRRGLCLKRIIIEPGRSIVAEAGYTLYRVGFQKKSADVHYVFVDGGMADNIRPALYQAKYRCSLANRINESADTKVTVAGKCCESADILIEDAYLPKPETGDLLVIYSAGAYGYSMASNYNRLGRPGVVFVKDGKARLVLRPETYLDMEKLEVNSEL